MHTYISKLSVYIFAVLTPTDPYILQGGKLELNCTILTDLYVGNRTARDIEFAAANEVIPSLYVHTLNETSAQLVIPDISVITNVSKPFSCRLPKTDDEDRIKLAKQYVEVASKCILNWRILS